MPSRSLVDIHVKSRARDHAIYYLRDHGDEAESVLRAKIANPDKPAANKVLYKLTLREIGRLRRKYPDKYGAGKPRKFAFLRRLFG